VPPFSHLTSCTLTKSNFYLANSLAAAVREPDLYRLLKNIMSLFHCLGHTKLSVQVQGFLCEHFITRYVFSVKSCKHFVQPPSWGTTPCQMSPTAYSIHLQLPSILEAIPPPKPKDAPCCGDRDPLITASRYIFAKNK